MLPTINRPALQTPSAGASRIAARAGLRSSILAVKGLAAGLALAGMTALGGVAPATAQSPFAAAVYVNDQAITNYDINQYTMFLEFLGIGAADLRATARERLIEDRLRMQEARRLGMRAAPTDITAGMVEFAARAELTPDEMIERMAGAGIDRATFENFIHSGILWRDLVNQRYGGDVRVTDAQIDQALSVAAVRPVPEVLMSEIFLPSDPQFAEPVAQLIPQILAINSIEEFGNAARQVSAAPSAPEGGRIERWMEIQTLPEPIAVAVSGAGAGTIIGPIEVPGAYAIFMIRAKRETRDIPVGDIEVEYRRVGLPGGRTEANLARAAQIRATTDGCSDLGRVVGLVAPEIPEGGVATITARQNDLSTGVATELARLNPGQITTNLSEEGALVVLMLCHRNVVPDPRPARGEIRMSLFNRALEGVADIYLQTLRAEAEIRTQ
ncbi:MAG TPA: hypothetical protein GX700_14505 [Paracoccus sp.]|nr:hypothetical protein [Paracoccus sp. (in: a-proteobacteria)]